MNHSKRKAFSLDLVSIFCLILLGIFSLLNKPIFAQDWVKPYIKNLQRVDLRNLGYPLVNEIPANSTAITSLLTASDGKIYGGTTGEEAYLFFFDHSINKVKHLGKIKSQQSIHHSLVEDKDGFIYLGTGKNPFVGIEFSARALGPQRVENTLWPDIKRHFQNYPGGHLYRYNPSESNRRVKLPQMECDLEDLGIPLANNSIYALTISPAGDEIYGLSYPDGHFFIYNIPAGGFKDLGEIDEKIVFRGPERHWRSLPRAMICDNCGNVYTSGTDGKLVYYNPRTSKIVTTAEKLPSDLYPGEDFSYAVVEYFAEAEEGRIYGGTSDGYLFSFKPGASIEVLNLGKLRSTRRLRALTAGVDGKIYMIAGERASTMPCQLFSYNTYKGGFENLGILIVDRSPHYYWRGYQFDCMTTGLDGTIYLGESERRSHLFLYIP